MRFDRNGWGGYELGKWNIYDSYDKEDKDGNFYKGHCWCIKEDLDSEVCDYIAETLEECIEWILETERR